MPIAYVLISCELGSEKAIVDELKSIEGVKEVQPTYGIYDVIAKVEVQDEHKLRDPGCARTAMRIWEPARR